MHLKNCQTSKVEDDQKQNVVRRVVHKHCDWKEQSKHITQSFLEIYTRSSSFPIVNLSTMDVHLFLALVNSFW